MEKNGKLSMVQGGNAISLNSASDAELKELKSKALAEHNKVIDEYTQGMNKHVEAQLDEASKLKSDLMNTEIRPFGNYILVKPYEAIPYEAMEETETGFLISKHSGIGLNPNSGEYEEMERFTRVGTVIAINPKCTHIKPGDDVYYRKAQGVPVPFMSQGFEVVSENSIQAVVGYQLTKRWNELEK